MLTQDVFFHSAVFKAVQVVCQVEHFSDTDRQTCQELQPEIHSYLRQKEWFGVSDEDLSYVFNEMYGESKDQNHDSTSHTH